MYKELIISIITILMCLAPSIIKWAIIIGLIRRKK